MKNSDDFIYGLHVVQNLLERSPDRILEILFLDSRQEDPKIQTLLKEAKRQGIPIILQNKKRFETLAGTAVHQGVLAKVRAKKRLTELDLEDLVKDCIKSGLFLILDGVQDPHNLGAALRTSDAFSVDAVIIPKDRAVSLTPLVQKVASGAAETVPLIEVTNLSRTLEDLKKAGLWIIGSSQKAKKSLTQTDLTGPIAIVLGAEGQGLRRLTEEKCDFLMQIPMFGTVESLNVSVAVGICLYEARRQRSAFKDKE